MKLADLPEVRNAPLTSKLELIQDLWAEIASKPDTLSLPAWHVAALEESAADYERNPREGGPWQELRDHLLREK
jgi:hypothetical protein